MRRDSKVDFALKVRHEFLECSEEWNSQEILNILNEDIMMFTWAKQAIEKHLNETQNEQD